MLTRLTLGSLLIAALSGCETIHQNDHRFNQYVRCQAYWTEPVRTKYKIHSRGDITRMCLDYAIAYTP